MMTRRYRLGLLACAGGLVFAVGQALLTAQEKTPETPARQVSGATAYRPVIDRYCIGCHSARQRSGGLVLEGMDLARVGADAATWEKVVRKLRTGVMPPVGMPRPDEVTRWQMVGWLEASAKIYIQ